MLIAAPFCMYDRYVTCPDTTVPTDPGLYAEGARRITTVGCRTAPAQS
ncbi:hypothetical protein [Streptomyces sp. 8L]|nr:hypothetical protein [Streptomyces sp. 8L]MCA1223650.1 hypothetical protein [Streptomyces sp. 8L]